MKKLPDNDRVFQLVSFGSNNKIMVVGFYRLT